MTICEKFKLMMASFEDIRAAIVEKGSTIAAVVSSIFPTVLFILLGLKADCTAVYFIGCIAFSIIDFINMSAVCAYKERQLKYKSSEVRKKCKKS